MSKDKTPTRRVRMMQVDPASFMMLFTKGMKFDRTVKIIDGVPADAKLLTVSYDAVRNGIIFVLESETYDEIPINVLPPIEYVGIQFGKKKS